MVLEGGGVSVHEAPRDVYDDFLEHYLLLNCCRRLIQHSQGTELPHPLGMLPLSDIVKWATDNLDDQIRQDFLVYVDNLAKSFRGQCCRSLPRPTWMKTQVTSPAEALATSLLDDGTCSLWSAARQVAVLLRREKPRHGCSSPDDEGESFTFGAYSKGPFSGFCRMTLTHPNSARLFNALISHLCPTHRWASVGVLYNCLLPLHTDQGNSKEPNLVTSLSLHDAGEIWIQCPGGTEFQEHAGILVPGQRFSVQMQAISFAAHKSLHCTCAWTAFDRVLLVAYTPGRWDALRAPQLDNLRELGFLLPDPGPKRRSPNLLDDCLPSILRD